MLKLDEEQAEKWHCKYTRERGGLPPCPFSDRLLVKVKWFTKCKDFRPKKKEVEKIRSLEVKNTEDRRQMTDEANFNQKFLRMFRGSRWFTGQFIQKAPGILPGSL